MSLLLCRQEPVETPYYVEALGIHLYSSQELCYVIYHNPLLVLETFVDDHLIEFIRGELEMGFMAFFAASCGCRFWRSGLKNGWKAGEPPMSFCF